MAEINLKISGMSCQHCVKKATTALTAVAGVEQVEVTLEPGAAIVQANIDPALLIAAIKNVGYEVEQV